jgi:predicted methyltransferase
MFMQKPTTQSAQLFGSHRARTLGSRVAVLTCLLFLGGCGVQFGGVGIGIGGGRVGGSLGTQIELGKQKTSQVSPTAEVKAAVAAPNRSADDRALDAGRHPAELMAFCGIKPGMAVGEIGAGGGYTTELLARIVGPEGKVFGQNDPFVLQRFAEAPWSERLAKPAMSNVTRVDSSFEHPFPSGTPKLDAVVIVLFYHDLFWIGRDPAAMNDNVFRTLKPSGSYCIVDHSAADGAGTDVSKSLHRVEESVVRRQVETTGFRLEAEADFLRNAADSLDWNAGPRAAGERRGTSDRFVLRYERPSNEALEPW